MANLMGMTPYVPFKSAPTMCQVSSSRNNNDILLGQQVRHLKAKNTQLEIRNARLEAQVAKLKAQLDTCENPVIYKN